MKELENIYDSWYVRQEVLEELDEYAERMADAILKEDCDYNDNDDCIVAVLFEYCDIATWTADEIDHAGECIRLLCGMIKLGMEGKIEKTPDGKYRITSKGRESLEDELFEDEDEY